jgi:hypothetical protein
MSRARSMIAVLLATTLPVLIIGCGDDLNLGKVAGVVTLDGKTVPDASVVFTPKGPGRPSQTKTDANGRFVLSFNASNQGALVGDHSVTVSTADITDDGRNIPELIPAQYNRKGSIDVTVTSGSNEINLELKSSK